MEALDAILADWRSCKPSGVVLCASRLREVIKCVQRRLQASADHPQKLYAGELLQPTDEGGGLPALVRLLRIDGDFWRESAAGTLSPETVEQAAESKKAVVHFVHFWQALGEVDRRLLCTKERETVADEIAAFQSCVLRDLRDSALTSEAMLTRIRCAQESSVDPGSWDDLLQIADLGLPQAGAAALQLHEVSGLLLMWLSALTEDYCRGARGATIQSMQHVVLCSRVVACEHLCACSWDIEAALRRFYAGASVMAALAAKEDEGAWGSKSAKLHCSERECQICCLEFEEGMESSLTGCCFQVLCVKCARSVTDSDGVFSCPFCRGMACKQPRLLLPNRRDAGDSSTPEGDSSSSSSSQMQSVAGTQGAQRGRRLWTAAGTYARSFKGMLTFVLQTDEERSYRPQDINRYDLISFDDPNFR
eukprot:TRINITY_DN113024_c0_g1_i1.p1 TRINITY_DN113024_c0_g1~~TRINITY_DN113024_c0_g1_i1.p1  ORF type:complete len:421 (+),score=78.39 TRINITY_DN113024_c0_g1_i1:63-1325(+)